MARGEKLLPACLISTWPPARTWRAGFAVCGFVVRGGPHLGRRNSTGDCISQPRLYCVYGGLRFGAIAEGAQ